MDSRWEKAFQYLLAYKEEFGGLAVPRRYNTGDSFALGAWVLRHRKYYKEGDLKLERVKRLEEIGFIWKIRESSSTLPK